jgi:hypothetical protein
VCREKVVKIVPVQTIMTTAMIVREDIVLVDQVDSVLVVRVVDAEVAETDVIALVVNAMMMVEKEEKNCPMARLVRTQTRREARQEDQAHLRSRRKHRCIDRDGDEVEGKKEGGKGEVKEHVKTVIIK